MDTPTFLPYPIVFPQKYSSCTESNEVTQIYEKHILEYQILCLAALAPCGRLGQVRPGQKYTYQQFLEYQIFCLAALAPYCRLGQARLGQKYKKRFVKILIIFMAVLAPYGRVGESKLGQKYKKHIQGITHIMCRSRSSINQVRLGQVWLEI